MKKLVYLLLLLTFCFSCEEEVKNTKLTGSVFGTSYSIQYYSNTNYQKDIDAIFHEINKSMSTYIPNSDISKINNNEKVELDAHFLEVLRMSKEAYRFTEGAFDPTIGAVVNAWDFGPEGKIENLDSLKIQQLMQFVGLNRVGVVDGFLQKPKESFIDFNAIAKGYAVDAVSDFLTEQKLDNFIVEIGGEIVCKGINIDKEKAWTVGIETPRFDGEQSIMKAISLQDEAMATSGTYRKFKVDESGNRYAHIINTKTGFPSKTNILSVSVIAPKCMMADAYATAFKTMGIEKVSTFVQKHDYLKVFLIFENENGELETLSLNNFPE